MKYRYLKDLKISEIGLGTWTLGGPTFDPLKGYPNGWAEVTEQDAIEGICYALEQGVNHFDTADIYGLGKAEIFLAKGLGKKINNVIIGSKVGYLKGSAEHAYSLHHLQQQFAQSLINLKRDYLDIYYFHQTDFGPNDCYLETALNFFQRLKKEGKIRLIGLSAYSTADFVKYLPLIKQDLIQCRANLLDTKFIKEKSIVSQLLEKEKIGCVVFSPFAQGLLLGKYNLSQPFNFEKGDYRKNNTYFSAEYLAKFEPKFAELKKYSGASPEDLARIALQFVLHYQVVTGTIFGFRNKAQVEVSLKCIDKILSEEAFYCLKRIFG